ncbi:MAG: acyl-CoA reductase [Candidatus Rifleibacteriota bacterium]
MKNLQLKKSSYVFGNVVSENWLDETSVKDVISDAFDHSLACARPDLNCIIEVLQRVADCWADPDYHYRKKAMRILPSLLNFSHEMVEEGFEVIASICSQESILKRLSGELGSQNILDDWIARPHHGFEVKALPKGVLLHLTAGNVFVGAVDSLVSGIITKNANILKMSRVDSVFPILFLESIKENDPEGVIWPHQSALLWKGGDEKIEGPLFEAPLTIVFWGGHEALASVKKRMGPSTELIENGPRYSFAIIDEARIKNGISSDLIKGLALDLCRWDQQACSSPHLVYVVSRNEKLVHRLMEKLFDELIELSESLPLGKLNFDEKVEIRKVRELAKMAQARNEGRLIAPEGFYFTLVYENNSDFKISCLNRTLFFKKVDSVNDILARIEPVKQFLQTVGLCLGSEEIEAWQQALIEAGARRLTNIGGMSEGQDGAPHEGDYLLTRLINWVDREYRDEDRLEKLLNRVVNSRYYGDIIQKAGGAGKENFAKLPLLDREVFYRNSPPESEAILTGPMTDAYIYASGGTTGSPKYTLYSNEEYRYVTDVLGEIYKNAGLCKDDRVANLFIAGNLWTSFNVAGRALENIGCLNLPVGGASDIENILNYLAAFKVNAVVGLPSIIIKLAEEIKKRGLENIRLEKILYGGEHLRPQTCEFLRKAVGAKIIRSAGYACVDTGPVGWQCGYLEGSIHHVLDQYAHVEILDPETLKPVENGQAGEIVATNLDRVLMPVIRYRTGDLGRWVEVDDCPCGYSGKSFELLGRCDDLLVIGGINLLPVDIAAGLSRLAVSQSFQAVARNEKGKDLLVLRLEAEKPLSDSVVINSLREGSYKIAESLHEGWMNVQIEWYTPGKIERNKRTGKLKPIIDQRF